MSYGSSEPGLGHVFPFSAVVGNDEAKLALHLAAIDPGIGGVLLRGDKGTAKTTLARGLAHLLPHGAPFAELPLGASEDRVTGSIDLAAVLADGSRRFEPGVLAAAHGGVLYVDEINLLADHLVDLVLDAAASGRNRVERDGVSHQHPSRFVLVGSMNPEEGELRPQLLDRFGLMVDVTAPADAKARVEAVDRRLAFDRDPQGFVDTWAEAEAILAAQLAAASPAHVSIPLRVGIAELCTSFGVEGLRADLVMTRATAALAAWEGRTDARDDDVELVAPLVLAHRRRRGPFDEPGVDRDEVSEAWDRARREARGEGAHDDSRGDAAGDSDSDSVGNPGGESSPQDGLEQATGRSPMHTTPGQPSATAPAVGPRTAETGGARVTDIRIDADPAPQLRAGRPAERVAARARGGTAVARSAPAGRLVRDRPADGNVPSVAVHASVVETAARRAVAPGADAVIREAVREQPRGRLVVLCLDTSGSMNAAARMEAAKGAALGLLVQAYQRRDRVALVTFGGDGAAVALRPTASVEVARRRLDRLSSGGVTPLAEGLRVAHDLITRSATEGDPLLVVISDGRASSAPGEHDPLAAAHAAAAEIARAGVGSIVVDADTSPVPLGLAADLAHHLGAPVVPIPTNPADLATAIGHTLS